MLYKNLRPPASPLAVPRPHWGGGEMGTHPTFYLITFSIFIIFKNGQNYVKEQGLTLLCSIKTLSLSHIFVFSQLFEKKSGQSASPLAVLPYIRLPNFKNN